MKRMLVMGTIFLGNCLFMLAKPGQADMKPQPVYKSLKVGEMVFQSAVDGKNLKVKIFAPTTGWIAVGFDPKSVMKGANFIIGYAEGGQAVLQDQFGVSSFRHKPDSELGGKDDILEKSASVLANGTEIAFTIPLDSGDPYDAKLEAGKTVPIILAYGTTTNMSKRHKHKYSATLEL